jgi:hypothetical protein
MRHSNKYGNSARDAELLELYACCNQLAATKWRREDGAEWPGTFRNMYTWVAEVPW